MGVSRQFLMRKRSGGQRRRVQTPCNFRSFGVLFFHVRISWRKQSGGRRRRGQGHCCVRSFGAIAFWHIILGASDLEADAAAAKVIVVFVRLVGSFLSFVF